MNRRPALLVLLSVGVAASAVFAASCGGHHGGSSPTPTPTPAAPVISAFTVTPPAVPHGGSVTLHVVFSGGEGSVIGVGAVLSSADVVVFPQSSARYTLDVTGAG